MIDSIEFFRFLMVAIAWKKWVFCLLPWAIGLLIFEPTMILSFKPIPQCNLGISSFHQFMFFKISAICNIINGLNDKLKICNFWFNTSKFNNILFFRESLINLNISGTWRFPEETQASLIVFRQEGCDNQQFKNLNGLGSQFFYAEEARRGRWYAIDLFKK